MLQLVTTGEKTSARQFGIWRWDARWMNPQGTACVRIAKPCVVQSTAFQKSEISAVGLVMIEKHDKNPESPRAFRVLVTRRRFELRTHCLKGSCSAD